MALMRWKPFEELTTLRKEMDRVFERFFGELPSVDVSWGWTPRLDMTEAKDSLTIKAELPGLEAKDLDVSLVGDALTSKGEKRQETEEASERRSRSTSHDRTPLDTPLFTCRLCSRQENLLRLSGEAWVGGRPKPQTAGSLPACECCARLCQHSGGGGAS